MLERFFGALLILVFGFDSIWLGCKWNGADNYRNPVWGFLSGFITLQEYILGFAASVGLAFAGWYLWSEVMSKGHSNYRPHEGSYEEPSHDDPMPKKRDSWSPSPSPQVHEPEYFRPREQNYQAKTVEQMVSATPKPMPQKPKLTAKELKEKAIQEFLGEY